MNTPAHASRLTPNNLPLRRTRGFTVANDSDEPSHDPVLARILDGNVNDPAWLAEMRDLIERCSSGPFTYGSGDPSVDPEPIAVVTNPQREVLAKCGPVRDARSCFDAILFAAAVNAIRKLVG